MGVNAGMGQECSSDGECRHTQWARCSYGRSACWVRWGVCCRVAVAASRAAALGPLLHLAGMSGAARTRGSTPVARYPRQPALQASQIIIASSEFAVAASRVTYPKLSGSRSCSAALKPSTLPAPTPSTAPAATTTATTTTTTYYHHHHHHYHHHHHTACQARSQ
jgi:hypothetical protein